MSILVVDDESDIRDLLAFYLRHQGYEVVTACNGCDALTCLQQRSELPELIVLDVMMPVMNGMEFRHAQRQDSALAAIPVAVMSAASNVQDHVPLLAADTYLAKPIDFATLLATVEHYCGKCRMRGA
jgi:DNA-binding response OmpR family regulator